MAVYTEIGDDELRSFTALYDIGEVLSCKGIAEGVENSNFLLTTGRGNFILTLYEKRVDPADLPWFLGLMEHLARRQITCPQPVRAKDGEALRILAGRHAAITTFLPGVWPRRVRVEHCGPVGQALAALHLAGADYAPTRVNALGSHGWRPLLDRCRDRGDEVSPHLDAELEQLPKVRVVVALGKIGFDAWLQVLKRRGVRVSPKPQFTHGAVVRIDVGDTSLPDVLIGCYHPSRQNTNTGVLTKTMMRTVFQKARRMLDVDR